MSESALRCHCCGTQLDIARGGGLCAACLFGEALDEPVAGVLGSVGGHELLEEIARGGMGIVYRARQLEPRREVALKTLPGSALASGEARDRFRLETRAMAALDHPGILPIHHYGEHDGVPYFTMKLAAGGSLAERRAEFAGQWRRIAELMADVADAIHFAHERGVLHRDLKPGNILFDERDRAYVCDFGLAKLAAAEEGLTRPLTILGTPHYLAPELVEGKAGAVATTSSDEWALGAILYELLSQRPPFEAESAGAVLRKIASEDPAPLSRETPRDLSVITLKALSRGPALRYATTREFAADLRRWLAGESILARPEGAGERLTRWTRRNPALALTAVALIVTLTAASALLWRANRQLSATLGDSLLAQASLTRAQSRQGTRDAALELIGRAIKLVPPADVARRSALRTESAAALALPEFRPRGTWNVFSPSLYGLETFSGDLSHFAAATADGGFGIWESGSQKVVRLFPPAQDERELRRLNPALQFSLSPDGRRVAAVFWGGNKDESHTRIFDVNSERQLAETRGFEQLSAWPAWLPDGGFIIGRRESGFDRYDSNGVAGAHFPPTQTPSGMGFVLSPLVPGPDGNQIAVKTYAPSGIAIWSLDPPRFVRHIPLLAEPGSMGWSSDGRLLAVGEKTPRTQPGEETLARTGHEIFVVEVGAGKIIRTLEGHGEAVTDLSFATDDTSVVSVGHDGLLVWQSLARAQFRLRAAAVPRVLGVHGHRIGYAPARGSLGVLELRSPAGWSAWPGQASGGGVTSVEGTTNGLLVMATRGGLELWDSVTRTRIAQRPWPAEHGPRWPWLQVTPDGKLAVVGDQAQPLRKFSIERRATGNGKESQFGIGERVVVGADWQGAMIQGFAPNGKDWVVGTSPGGRQIAKHREFHLWPDGDPERARKIASDATASGIHLVGDGRFGITAHLSEPDAHVWDTASARRVRSLGIPTAVSIFPDPTRRYVASIGREGAAIWDTSSWKRLAAWPSPSGGARGSPRFTPDGKRVALHDQEGRIWLRRVPGGEEDLTLVPPTRLPGLTDIVAISDERMLLITPDGVIYEWNLQATAEAARAEGLTF